MVWNIGKTLIYLERRILYLTHTSSMSLEMRGCGEDRQLQPWALFSSLPWGETLYVQHSILFLWYKQSASEWAGYVNKSSDWIQRGGLILDRGFLWGLSRDIWHDWSEESLVETELTLFHWNCAAFFHIIGALKPLCAEQLQDEKLSEPYFFADLLLVWEQQKDPTIVVRTFLPMKRERKKFHHGWFADNSRERRKKVLLIEQSRLSPNRAAAQTEKG